jgi:hypothetical protein
VTIPVTTKNDMLNGQTFTDASLHSDFPGNTGANELTGGTPAYARQAIVINAAAGGQRALNAAVTFNVPPTTVKWVGFWNSTVFVGCCPNGGATPKNFTALTSNSTVYAPAHGYANTQKVTFYNGTPPGGLSEGVTYFVVNATTDTFQVAATSGGTAITFTLSPSFGCVMAAITEDVYATQGTHQLNTSTFTIPD